MCGIAGAIGGESPLEQIVLNLRAGITHRGPDGEGVWSTDGLSLAHTRLAILDLSETANQPMLSDNGELVIVFNGEVYNHLDLRLELSDYPFKTTSDTETILAGWSKWGAGVLEKLNGMFAFCIHNTQTDECWLVRDRMGIKPLYYAVENNTTYFCSEIKPLLKEVITEPSLDISAVAEFLRMQTVREPRTLVNGVDMLEAGCFLHFVKGASPVVKRYWSTPEHSLEMSRAEAVESIRDKVTRAVERRLISDVPLGAFLSGGVDSSIVTAVVANILDKKLSTYAIVFEEQDFNEAAYSNEVAKKCGTDHQQLMIKGDALLGSLPDIVGNMDFPSGDGINTYTISKAVKDAGISVALSGLGADELFQGYPLYQFGKKLMAGHVRGMAKAITVPLAFSGSSVRNNKLREALKSGYKHAEDLYPYLRKLYSEKELRVILSGTHSIRSFSGKRRLGTLAQLSELDIQGYMRPVLLRDSDQMGMAHALEIRVPFLDHEVVEMAFSIPEEYRADVRPKGLLIEAFNDVIPETVWNRKKMGFVFPWEVWLKNELKSFVEQGLSKVSKLDCINAQEVDRLWLAFQNDDPTVNWSRIWLLVVLGIWCDQNNVHG